MNILLVCLIGCTAKSVSMSFKTTELAHRMTYLTKFGINVGSGIVEFKMRFKTPQAIEGIHQVRMNTYIDDAWPMTMDELECQSKQRLTKYVDRVSIPLNGDWSTTYKRTLKQKNRDHIWLFTNSDCDGDLLKYGGSIEFNIVITNNGSHFSCEHNNMHWLYLGQALVSIVIIGYCLRRLLKLDELDGFLTGITIVLGVDLLAELLLYLHYQIYLFNGTGFVLFDLSGSLLAQGSGLMLSALLILVSQGWTITKSAPEYQSQIPLAAVVLFVHTVVLNLIKILDEEQDQYHSYSGKCGLILILLKIAIWGYFVKGIVSLWQQANLQIQGFLQVFAVAASLFMLNFPIGVWIADTFVAAYWRFRVISMTNILVTHICILFLVYLCTSRSTAYSQIRNKTQTII